MFLRRFNKGFEAWEDISVERFNQDGLPLVRELGKDLIAISPRWCYIVFCVQNWQRGGWDEPTFLFTQWERKNNRWVIYNKIRLWQKHVRKAMATVAAWMPRLDTLKVEADAKVRRKPSKIDELIAVNAEAWADKLTGS